MVLIVKSASYFTWLCRMLSMMATIFYCGEVWADDVTVLDSLPLPTIASSALIDGVSRTKWHPGHYILTPMGMNERGFLNVLEILRSIPNFRGIQKLYTWTSLEPEEGVYDFSEIRTDLMRLSRIGKRLVVQVQYKSFRGDLSFAPLYLNSSKFKGGTYRHGVEGRNVLLWNDAVRDRLIALYQAMGRDLDAEVHLEAVVIPESSPGHKEYLIEAGYDEERYAENLRRTAKALRAAFPHTVTFLYANYPKRLLDSYSGIMRETGLGLGGPDLFPYSAPLNRGTYLEYSKLFGVVPLSVAAQSENYTAREYQGAYSHTPAIEMYKFARDTLRVNYIFWLWFRRPIDYFAEVERLIDEQIPPYGGLNSACPTKFGGCVE